jgi:hypothetical protein
MGQHREHIGALGCGEELVECIIARRLPSDQPILGPRVPCILQSNSRLGESGSHPHF